MSEDARLIAGLARNAQRGSKPRCHLMTHGDKTKVAATLSELVNPWAMVSATDNWMPEGFSDTTEAELPKATRLLADDLRRELANWWLAAASDRSRTPNWDIASTCMIDGKKGILLIEAKAHDNELLKEESGKRLDDGASDGSSRNHKRIQECFDAANAGLGACTNLSWALARDRHYQMSNRFAWSWKIAECGIPVVLVYLGFLRAYDMKDQGKPFASHNDWENLVIRQSATLFPKDVWNKRWSVGSCSVLPMIRSLELPLPG